MTPQVQIDGIRATVDALSHPALVNYGHFTAMQVRHGAVRGLELHLARLRAAHLELFGTNLDTDRVQRLMRRAVAQRPDAYLRVTLSEVESGLPQVMTAVRPPIDASARPQTLTEVRYVRPLPHIKHVGTFAQIRYGLLAERAGFDDAVLVADDGRIVETTTANIGFIAGQTVVWPDAPSLRGITWQLLDAGLSRRGLSMRSEPITVDTLGNFDAAFTANSIGISPAHRIGAHEFPLGHRLQDELTDIYATVPWDPI